MKTNDLISNLSKDLAAAEPLDRMMIFLAKWCLGSALFAIVFAEILPLRADLQNADYSNFMSVGFWIEETLWLGLMLASATIVYRSRIPGLGSEKHKTLGLTIIGALIATIFLRSADSWSGLETVAAEFHNELSFYQGRCGILILMTGMAWAAALMFFTSRGAPTQPASTGAWIAVSSGALIALVMPLICAHENTLHVLIWHCVPVGLLAFLGAAAGRKWLRW